MAEVRRFVHAVGRWIETHPVDREKRHGRLRRAEALERRSVILDNGIEALAIRRRNAARLPPTDAPL